MIKYTNMNSQRSCSLLKKAKPFVKWAGGKSQLLSEIDKLIPNDLENYTYIEPFVGGGAVFFWLVQKYPNIKKAVINDINKDLIDTYVTIKNNVDELIEILKIFEKEYHELSNKIEMKKEYYYSKRILFNERTSDSITQSALFIFLNKTCFNGLYRVNRKNEFNVPMGSYKTLLICDEDNLRAVSDILKNTVILNVDFEKTLEYAGKDTFFYLDPPYKPLSKTSSFNSYTSSEFNDKEQIRLAKFCKKIDVLGHKWILSNSDVKNGFFDELYSEFNIQRVYAKRSINSNPKKRGELTELLVTNYEYGKVMSTTK
jgi:DNA adenine methylase